MPASSYPIGSPFWAGRASNSAAWILAAGPRPEQYPIWKCVRLRYRAELFTRNTCPIAACEGVALVGSDIPALALNRFRRAEAAGPGRLRAIAEQPVPGGRPRCTGARRRRRGDRTGQALRRGFRWHEPGFTTIALPTPSARRLERGPEDRESGDEPHLSTPFV